MISKAIKFTSLLLITVFALLPFIFFKGDGGLVFGTVFDQSIFEDTGISTGTKALVSLIGTLSLALIILLVIFFLYESFLETKTFGLVMTMNIMLIISMIVFSVYLYGFILIDSSLNETIHLTVGETEISSLTYNIAMVGTTVGIVFVLFVYSNVLWFPVVADKFRYKKKLGFSFKPSKKNGKEEKTKSRSELETKTSNGDVDDFEALQPGLERNELQQRKAAASFGRVPIDEFEEAYGLDLKTQVLTNEGFGEPTPIPLYKTEVPKIFKEDLEVPKKSREEVDEIFSDYENKLKEERFSAVQPKYKSESKYNPEPKQMEEGYIMPRNRSNMNNQDSDDLIFIPPSSRSKSSEPTRENMFSDLERIERLMSFKNKQVQFEPRRTSTPEPDVEVPKPKKVKKEKTKVLVKQSAFEDPTYDFTEVEDPLKEVVTNTINIYTEETEKEIAPAPTKKVAKPIPIIKPVEYNEDTYEEDTDERIFNQTVNQSVKRPAVKSIPVANFDIDTYEEDTDERIFNQTVNQPVKQPQQTSNVDIDTYEEDTDEHIFNQTIDQPVAKPAPVVSRNIDTYEEDTDEHIFNQAINSEQFIEVKNDEEPKTVSTIDWDLD